MGGASFVPHPTTDRHPSPAISSLSFWDCCSIRSALPHGLSFSSVVNSCPSPMPILSAPSQDSKDEATSRPHCLTAGPLSAYLLGGRLGARRGVGLLLVLIGAIIAMVRGPHQPSEVRRCVEDVASGTSYTPGEQSHALVPIARPPLSHAAPRGPLGASRAAALATDAASNPFVSSSAARMEPRGACASPGPSALD